MPISTYKKVGISAMASAVPTTKLDNSTYQEELFGKDYITEVLTVTGIKERRVAAPDVSPSDLGYAAAENLLSSFDIDRESIDVVIFSSEMPDYKFPHTASILQHRLSLSKDVMAFDMPSGCAGAVYALSVAMSLLQETTGLKKALIIFAETHFRSFSPNDRSTAYLFGDGASCALLEAGEQWGESYVSISTDGSKSDLIIQPTGGARNPVFTENDFGKMDGGAVFQTVISEVPRNIKSLLYAAQCSSDDIDCAVFHQANLYIIKHLSKKLKLSMDKVPVSIDRFGNLSSASIPLTMTECCAEQLRSGDKTKVLISAFGTGMTWGSALFDISSCRIAPLVEV